SLEGAIAMRRLAALAPNIRCALEFRDDAVALWLNDDVPSRTVHTSEIGWLRFDATAGEIVFERLDGAALAADRSLEAEHDARTDYLVLLESLRRSDALRSTVLCEGLDRATFVETRDGTRSLLEIHAGGATARVALTTAGEEPYR
ncbi:MAG: hypothetical protein ACO3QC_08760, partial [Phycisphaerales bacterium]